MIPRVLLPLVAAGTALAAPLLKLDDAADIIADSFNVVLKPDADLKGFLASESGFSIAASTTYDLGSFKGFSGLFSQPHLDSLLNLSQVAYIEPATRVTTYELVTQNDAPWGLARISHRRNNSTDYIYDSSAGEGTFAYIIDTGIYVEHEEFEGRATFGANFAGDGEDTDGNGHGTHVSGTIGAKTYGVAKKAQLIGVKVLDASGSGSTTGVLAGIEWAVNDAKTKGRIGKAVANLSLGGVFSQATKDAVAAAVSEGLFVAVAAGNDGAPAGLTSPASEKSACTVGASDKRDTRASYSNFGSIVDIFAPGSEIISTWIRSPTDTNTISGTSMATPHVAGLGAYLLALEGADSRTLCERVRELATKDALGGINGILPGLTGTPNLLAYNGNGA